MPSLSSVIAIAIALLLVACGEKNPNFCEGADCDSIDASPDSPPITCTGNGPDPSCPAATPVCAGGQCTGMCTSDADCTGRPATEAVCHMASGACVQCDETDVQATPMQAEDECPAPNLAVCDGGTHTCRACEDHTECFSGVCDAGTCVAQANVIYLTPMAEGGTDGGMNDCLTPSTGCLTLHHAIGRLTATRKYIHFKPSATPYPARNNMDRADFDGVTAHVIGYGAEVRRGAADGEVIEIRGGSNVTIEGLKIANAINTGSGSGIRMSGSTLNLFEVIVDNNDYRGVDATGGGTLSVRRSVISNNSRGGILFNGVDVVLVNNFITGNGDLSLSDVGGVSLSISGTSSTIEFNTIAGNLTGTGTAHGLICTNTAAAQVVRNNIVTSEANRAQASGACTHEYTLFGGPGTAPTGTGNMNIADPAMFMFVSGSDYHLQPGSIAAGKAQSTSLVGDSLFDIDGDSRAQGAATVDVGADEIP
ncbi:MAG: right-handed parallel beta-helix repeat-containing protein [Deltaproteobacteria bacterium]|nr:right-handed parallel beta-helix repeat-containing protein [Kofleriaceae bacterium]